MIPIIQKEPAVIAAAVVAVLQAVILLGFLQMSAEQLAAINIALVAVLGLFVRQTSTPTASPTLEAGTSVAVKGTTDSVVIQPTPPGPAGVEGGGIG